VAEPAREYGPRVVERFEDMPAETLGFRLSGKISRDEYFQILDPVRERLERGERVSFLVATAEDFHGLDLSALWEDVKVAGTVGLKHRSAWERLAVVTDKDWMRHAVAAFGWVIPGEVRVFEPADLEEAKAWTGGAGSHEQTGA
jgi:SpoIIAA-like